MLTFQSLIFYVQPFGKSLGGPNDPPSSPLVLTADVCPADMPKKYEKLKMNYADKLPINVNAADVLAINANSDIEMINNSKSTQMVLCNLKNSISPAIHVQLPLYTI